MGAGEAMAFTTKNNSTSNNNTCIINDNYTSFNNNNNTSFLNINNNTGFINTTTTAAATSTKRGKVTKHPESSKKCIFEPIPMPTNLFFRKNWLESDRRPVFFGR